MPCHERPATREDGHSSPPMHTREVVQIFEAQSGGALLADTITRGFELLQAWERHPLIRVEQAKAAAQRETHVNDGIVPWVPRAVTCRACNAARPLP